MSKVRDLHDIHLYIRYRTVLSLILLGETRVSSYWFVPSQSFSSGSRSSPSPPLSSLVRKTRLYQVFLFEETGPLNLRSLPFPRPEGPVIHFLVTRIKPGSSGNPSTPRVSNYEHLDFPIRILVGTDFC